MESRNSEDPPGPEEESVCRVCGYDDGAPFWEGGWPTSDICPCCGNESDISDLSVSGIRSYRGYWVGNGAKWQSPGLKPKGWDLAEQLKNIPIEWR